MLRVSNFCLPPRSPDVGIVYLKFQISSSVLKFPDQIAHLRCKLQTRQGLTEVGLQRTDHHKHKSFRITTKRKLEKVCELETIEH